MKYYSRQYGGPMSRIADTRGEFVKGFGVELLVEDDQSPRWAQVTRSADGDFAVAFYVVNSAKFAFRGRRNPEGAVALAEAWVADGTLPPDAED